MGPLIRQSGSLRAEVSASRTVSIDLSALSPGVHEAEARFFKLNSERRVEWLVSQVCDHAAGRLIVRAGQDVAVCPLHGWTLDLETLRYRNVGVTKQRLAFSQNGPRLEFTTEQQRLVFPFPAAPVADPLTVRFITHATLLIEAGGMRVMTDPWLIGPAFLTGWWLQHAPKDDCLDLLASCDAIYISHNHPDHCHLETLSLVARDKPILVPQFTSGSAASLLQAQGFTNVMPLPFRDVFAVGSSGLELSMLKSGDFRDDSGLFVRYGDRTVLLTVDSKNLNGGVLPEGVDLLMTSFAGGASGYPLCFDIYDEDTKRKLATRNRRTVFSALKDTVRKVQPRVYAPYAGYFTEAASRDGYIRTRNEKNSVQSVNDLVQSVMPETRCVDPTDTDLIRLHPDGTAEVSRHERAPLYEISPTHVDTWIHDFQSANADLDPDHVMRYFEASGFRDDFEVYVQPTDDEFQPLGDGYLVDFSGPHPAVSLHAPAELRAIYDARVEAGAKRREYVRVRQAPFTYVVNKMMPWEDLSIGFQCRIDRSPDTYNSDFWFHFTNTYITKSFARYDLPCTSCESILHSLGRVHHELAGLQSTAA